MSQAQKQFERMVRISPEMHQRATVVAKFEGQTLKEFVEAAVAEAIERRQIKIIDALAELNAAVKAAATAN